MNREWALSLSAERAAELEADYRRLLESEKTLSQGIPSSAHDAYTELVGFPARVLAKTGLIFMTDRAVADRKVQGVDTSANQQAIEQLRSELEADVKDFNTNIAGGKWNRMMPGLVTGKDLTKWSSQVRWPWGEPVSAKLVINTNEPAGKWRDAATADRKTAKGSARWSVVEGLGPSGHAVALQPASLDSAWKETDKNAPALRFDFTAPGGDIAACIDFLPSFRIYPGMKLRVTASLDDKAPMVVEVPGSSGAENENGTIRSLAVQNNYTRAKVLLPGVTAGKLTFTIRAMDPGIVVDRVLLP
jgi:hypothetical protein